MPLLARLTRRVAATTVLAVAASFMVFTPGAAAADSAATCALNIQLEFRPGLTLRPSSGSVISQAPGSLVCVGVIEGALVTGPGTFAVRGSYVGTIASGTTSGDAAYTIPTTGGPAGGTVRYSVTWLGLAGFITVEDDVYGNGSGPFAFLPNGDGILRPVASIRWISQQITFGSGAPRPA